MDTLRAFTHPRHSALAFAPRAHALQADSRARTILIIGAGFSGTAVAIHLLRLPHTGPLRIVLIERAHMARGVAYARREGPYLLNVPAGRMSASSVDPLEFLDRGARITAHAVVLALGNPPPAALIGSQKLPESHGRHRARRTGRGRGPSHHSCHFAPRPAARRANGFPSGK